jgi:hypothetical protein
MLEWRSTTCRGSLSCWEKRNRIDDQIAAIIDRPMTSGHLGEWIAS